MQFYDGVPASIADVLVAVLCREERACVKPLVRPFLFAACRLGLFLAVVAWIVGPWYDVEFLAHGLNVKVIVDRCGITFTRDWRQPLFGGGGFGGGFGGGYTDTENLQPVDATTPQKGPAISEGISAGPSEDASENKVQITPESFAAAIFNSESGSDLLTRTDPPKNVLGNYQELMQLIVNAESGDLSEDSADGSITINGDTISLVIGGPNVSYLDPVPQPDYRADSERGWVEVQSVGMVFDEPPSSWFQWGRLIQPGQIWSLSSGLHIRHCLHVTMWSLLCGLLVIPRRPETSNVDMRKRRWSIAFLSLLGATVIVQNGMQSREEWLVERLLSSGAEIHYEGGHAAFVEAEPGRLDSYSFHSAPYFDDDDLRNAAALPRLKYIQLDSPNITDAGIRALRACGEIQSLELSFYDTESQITDAGLMHIGHLTSLKSLRLHGIPFSDRGLSEISALSQLRQLVVDGAQITDAGLIHLHPLKHLQSVEIQGCRQVSTTALEDLKRFLPDCYVRSF